MERVLIYRFTHIPIVSVTRRRELFFDAFTSGKAKNMNGGQTSFAVLVKKLQESLTRIESFDVTTVSQSSDGVLYLDFDLFAIDFWLCRL